MNTRKFFPPAGNSSLPDTQDFFSNSLISQNFTAQESALVMIAQKFIVDAIKNKSKTSAEKFFAELSESQDILFKLNLDGSSQILNLLFSIFEIGADTSEIFKTFPDKYEKALRSFLVLGSIQIAEWEESELIHQIVLATNLDFRTVFILLAKKLAKIRKIDHYEPDDQKKIAKECLNIFAPIAHRLGLYPIKNELETISFRTLNPEIYQSVLDECSKPQQEMSKVCKDFAKKMHIILEKLNLKFEINFRNKLPYSIYRKAQNKKERFKNLNDLVACRIHTGETMECYKILGAIHNEYLPMENRFKDYISSPKPNGYQSLHTTLIMENGNKMEVQIRTYEMHQVSEKGIGAHWAYKKGQTLNLKENEQILWVRELAEKLKRTNNPRETFDIFNRELYSDSIYVFSPKGKLVKLPLDASVIDFAYSIHSDIGNHCHGSKINGIFKPIRTRLQNGDQVEIMVHKNAHPNSSWLKIAATNKAQYHIRAGLREMKKQNAAELGKEILRRELKRNLIPAEKFEEKPEFLRYLKKNKFSDAQEFLQELGMGNREIASLINFLNFKPPKKNLLPEKFLQTFKFKSKEQKLIGAENLPVHFAQCCQPVPGDQIVGLIKQNGSIGVHFADCNKLKKLDDLRRIIELRWHGTYPDVKPVRFEFRFPYSLKTFNKITKWIEKQKIEIVKANLKQVKDEGIYTVVLNFQESEKISRFQKKIESFGDIKIQRS